ncbi:MAG: UDP-N-acetylmuramyl-tripeptide synthetase [Candidatus Moranbacteria bacterium GW2011_GWF2_34_56]|nr:MAG: UDP-N-acetylmuramyl-tripeptide synthetase [Candidatus Moranbacteria bacterium GW2011_GWF1_34_10]KKP64692.1 MAG: UDP-N-acetylmuramyl-tripeptide synthetase [Candidatus Moranbacteria bacterium GW2011_GWF2_34_56]
MKKLIPQNLKNIYHLFQAILANLWFGFPSRKIKVIGITGTDGKTTTTQMVAKILEGANKRVAMASTINFKINEKEWTNLSHFTTLSAFAVQKFIRQAVDNGCEYLVLETSSHSLDQYRVWGINYKTALITNATREHLDYHKNMENYRQAKRKLFDKVETAIVNLGMEKPNDFLDCNARDIFGYGLKNESYALLTTSYKLTPVIAENIELGIDGSVFTVGNQKFTLSLVGDFNIENALAAISVGISENIDLESCAQSLAQIKSVPGRMEYVPNERGLNILVDFALTPEALKKLYALLSKIKKPEAKVIAVFGACGERDRGKRPIIGEIVSQYADFVILTNDEPYHEDPIQIINEIAVGIKNKKEGQDFWIIPDRREAIRFALKIARPNDIIAVTGMGAEESMVVGDKKIPWNDRKVILEELSE